MPQNARPHLQDGSATRRPRDDEWRYPSVFRLSDPEETNLMLKLYNVDETLPQPLLDRLQGHERCLFLGFTDGEKGYSRNVAATSQRLRSNTAACR
ncbi:MAG: hypothetical protein ACLTG4_04035 [Oscillospiraceae bacterium]